MFSLILVLTPTIYQEARPLCGCLDHDLESGEDYLEVMDSLVLVEDLLESFDEDTTREVVSVICSAPMAEGDQLQVRASRSRLRNGQRRVYPRVFRSFEGIGKARPPNVRALAPNSLELNSDALARHSQQVPSTHTGKRTNSFEAVIYMQENTHKVPKSASQLSGSWLDAAHSSYDPSNISRRFALGARDVCLGRRKLDVLRPGIVGMRGLIVLRLRLCMKRVHPPSKCLQVIHVNIEASQSRRHTLCMICASIHSVSSNSPCYSGLY